MLKTFYVPFNGDLYEITTDIFGDIEQATVYRDNNNSVGERLSPTDLPKVVLSRLNDQVSRWFSDLGNGHD